MGERAGAWIRLPHEVRDHPDADLSARLAHIWSHGSEIGVCGVISVKNSLSIEN